MRSKQKFRFSHHKTQIYIDDVTEFCVYLSEGHEVTKHLRPSPSNHKPDTTDMGSHRNTYDKC